MGSTVLHAAGATVLCGDIAALVELVLHVPGGHHFTVCMARPSYLVRLD